MEEHEARKTVDAFCRAATAETGDFWEVVRCQGGTLDLVQNFGWARTLPPERKVSMPTGAVYCSSGDGFAGLVEEILTHASGAARPFAPPVPNGLVWPLPWLGGCGSEEELALRLAAAGDGAFEDVCRGCAECGIRFVGGGAS